MAEHAKSEDKSTMTRLAAGLALVALVAIATFSQVGNNLGFANENENTNEVFRAYTGPLPISVDQCASETGTVVTVKGQRLGLVTSVTVQDAEAEIVEQSSTSLSFETPTLTAGTYDVLYGYGSTSVTHSDGLNVCGEDPFYVVKRVSGYNGDLSGVVESDRQAIQEFVQNNPGLEKVTCVGSTSGVPAIATDAGLAKARAVNACDIISELQPQVTTKTNFVTGRGVGQFHRAVILYGVGKN